MNTMFPSLYTAFAGDQLVARGAYAEVARALSADDLQGRPVLVFDDATGAQVDAPPPPEHAARLARTDEDDAAPPRPAPGRPRLGVVAREVTLLPRHWEWLSQQRGGASAALRRLVDEARRLHEPEDRQRAARERAYRFMSALASDWPEFEEASRALFAGDALALTQRTRTWPPDAREHLMRLAEGAFAGVPQPAPQP